MLICHFIGLAMGLGTGIGFIFLGMAASKLAPEEARKFAMNAFALSRMGHIGLTLLILSGGYLIIPFWGVLSHSPFLIAKLTLVLILIILLTIIGYYTRRAKNGEFEKYFPRIKRISPLSLLTTIAIITMAVLNFK
jgi:uncharacterized membrane protein